MSITLVYHLLKLLRNQWLTKEELEQLQQRKLQKIIKHAYEKVSYYHQLLNSVGVKPEDIRNKKDLRYIPITSRTRIQNLPTNEITAQGVMLRDCHRMTTSGSTGMPLEIIKSEKDYQLSNLTMLRSLLANGYRLTDRHVVVHTPKRPRRYWFRYLGLMRQSCISPFDNLDDQIKQLKRARPDLIGGLSSSLRCIAEEIRETHMEDISPRVVVTGGELLDPKTRQTIQSGFRSKVVDFYNSYECGNIAWECDRHEGYHINIDSLVVEIVNNGKPAKLGEKGEVVITNLDSYAMPLIRYRIKDIATGGESLCSCGRGLPLLWRIEGRTDDEIVLSSGAIVSPFELLCRLEGIPGILQFRVIQEKINSFVIQLNREPNAAPRTLMGRVRKELGGVLGDRCGIEIKIVDEISRDPSGKIRSVISNVEQSSSKGL